MTRRTFTAGLAAATILRAQTARERGRTAIEKAIQALGGNAFRNMRTRTETGRVYSFYREQLNGLAIARIYTKYLLPDNSGGLSRVERQVLGKKGEDIVLLTPKDAYNVTYRGAKPLAAERVAEIHETTLNDVLYILHQRMGEPGLEFESKGIDVVENQRVEVVDIFDSQNRNVTVWLSAQTYLPVKQRFYHYDSVIKDRREEVTRFTRFRDSGGGVMWPYSTERERDTEKIFQLFADNVAVNEALDDSLFALPNGIKILTK